MKKTLIILILIPFSINAQINSKIEGITINAPCELEFTRNSDALSNYACVLQDDNENISQYSVTVQNLIEDMDGITLEVYKDHFYKRAIENAQKNKETATLIKLINGQKALNSKSVITYSGQKFKNTSIIFLYKEKAYFVNFTTNNINRKIDLEDLINRIIFK